MTAMESPLRRENALLIQLQRDDSALGVTEADWRIALEQAVPDAAVGIRHAAIAGDPAYRTHVAAIPRQVGCHYHAQGDEGYSVVQGNGILFFAKVIDGAVPADQWRSIEVRTGDSFVIPEGYAHQLRRVGSEELTIIFACPDSHLDDSMDRHLLSDAPGKVGGLSAEVG